MQREKKETLYLQVNILFHHYTKFQRNFIKIEDILREKKKKKKRIGIVIDESFDTQRYDKYCKGACTFALNDAISSTMP